MRNVQVAMDDELLRAFDAEARSLRMSRSAAIRDAVRTWLRRREVERFERRWIEAVKKVPDDVDRVEQWREAQTWSDE